MTIKDEKTVRDEPLLLRPSRAFQLADVPRSTGYMLISSGEWPSVRIGRAIRIPTDGLRAWIARKIADAEKVREAEL